MRNRQVGPDAGADRLAEIVAGLTYKPGWRFSLQELSRGQGCEGLTLAIEATVPNSVGPGTVDVCHLMPVRPSNYDRESWLLWVLEQILLVERHEAMEFFRVDGRAPFFPEHRPGRDPYMVAFVEPVKSQASVDAPALPWSGGLPSDPHFYEQ